MISHITLTKPSYQAVPKTYNPIVKKYSKKLTLRNGVIWEKGGGGKGGKRER